MTDLTVANRSQTSYSEPIAFLVMVGFPPVDGFEVGFAASLDEAASVIASATRVVSRRMMSPCFTYLATGMPGGSHL